LSLRRREKWLWVCVGAALLIGFLDLIPYGGEICEKGDIVGHKECTTHGLPVYLAFKIQALLDQLGVAITALATIAIAWFTLTLRKSTDNLWYAAKATADAQEGDTKILQRAYLSVEPGGVSASGSLDKAHPNITIRNAGNLPARHVRWTIKWQVSQDHRLAELPVDAEVAEGNNTLPPGTAMTQGGPIIYIGDDPHDLRKEVGLYLYIWGGVIYDDGFGNERQTNFCHRYNAVNLTMSLHQEIVERSGAVRIVDDGYRIDHWHARFHRYGNDAT
jgi:hypothetical protein